MPPRPGITQSDPAIIVPDPIPIPPAPAPPPAKSLWANIISGIGIVMMLLGYGYQKAQKDDPQTISAMGDGVDWVQLSGLLITVGGAVKHTLDKKDNEAAAGKSIDLLHASAETALDATHSAATAAAVAADMSPPTDPHTGLKGSATTIAAGIEQAMLEGNTKLAGALVKAVEENPAS